MQGVRTNGPRRLGCAGGSIDHRTLGGAGDRRIGRSRCLSCSDDEGKPRRASDGPRIKSEREPRMSHG
ncbi:MAG: hypothetical protein KA191_17985 [Verrucomicrobia bacterium]|nr:hypothetical protein [Verrucomicrobiota bacterium]